MKAASAENFRPPAPLPTKILLGLVVVMLYLPMIYMVLGAFSDGEHWTLKWFVEVFEDDALLDALNNSMLVAFASSAIACFLGSTASLSIHYGSPRVRTIINSVSGLALVLPEIVFSLSLLSWFFILKIPLSLMTVIFAHVSFSISFVILTVSARLADMDISLNEAARDLGASEWQILLKVILPMLKPAILVGFVLSFLLSFDDFLITFFVNGIGTDTLPVKLYTSMKTGLTPKLTALSTLMLGLTSVLFLLVFRSPSFKNLMTSKP